MILKLSQIRSWLGASPAGTDGAALSYALDSRFIRPGDLFFAIRGPRHDGHDFVPQALRRGAVAAVVDRPCPAEGSGALVRVEDTEAALGQLAARARKQWGGPVIAVTGSSGKTTTKDTIATLLEGFLEIGKSEGNLNNQYGLPLSLLRIPDGARAAVVEAGINHPGEMAALASIAAPTVSVVTNVGAAHVGNFDSVDQIAVEKGRLVEALRADGTAVLNADDDRVAAFGAIHAGRTVTYGIDRPADVRARDIQDLGASGVRFRLGGRTMESPLAGRHNVYNLLAAIAAAGTLGIPADSLGDELERLRPSPMRGEVRTVGGITLIDDCYNANPPAMGAMLQVLRRTAADRRIAVLGEMRELGDRSPELHRKVGRLAASSGVDYLVAVCGDAAEIAAASGLPGEFHESPQEAAESLLSMVRPGDAVLLKASRGVGLERARDPLLEHLGAAAASEGMVS